MRTRRPPAAASRYDIRLLSPAAASTCRGGGLEGGLEGVGLHAGHFTVYAPQLSRNSNPQPNTLFHHLPMTRDVRLEECWRRRKPRQWYRWTRSPLLVWTSTIVGITVAAEPDAHTSAVSYKATVPSIRHAVATKRRQRRWRLAPGASMRLHHCALINLVVHAIRYTRWRGNE